jgi:serpin B
MRALAYTVGLVATACSSRPDVLVARELPASVRADAEAVVASNTQFAIDVYRELPGGNTIFSPFTISTAFAMLDAGAAGDTDTQLRQILHFSLPTDTLQTAFGALLTSIDVGRGYDNYTLATADRLFGQQGEMFLPAYLTVTKTDFQAELQALDFSTNPDGSLTTINDWVSTQTDGKIPTLFPPGSIDAGTLLALANAILFEGKWPTPFDASLTADAQFAVDGQQPVTVPMMHSDAISFSLAAVPGGTLALVPFAGGDLSFMVLLPNAAGGLAALEDGLTGQVLVNAAASAQRQSNCAVSMPKFTLPASFTLTTIMSTLGAPDAFTEGAADFFGIDGAMDLFVQKAFHDASITVDEQGADAAATTGGGSGSQTVLQVDHSFAYGIYDNVTGSVLLFGRMLDPSQAQ